MSPEIILSMKKFGRVLTDRQDGKKVCIDIINSGKIPNILDFSEVISLGSSFGDEILPMLAKNYNNTIYVKNANEAVISCIKKIIEDTKINVEYID